MGGVWFTQCPSKLKTNLVVFSGTFGKQMQKWVEFKGLIPSDNWKGEEAGLEGESFRTAGVVPVEGK